MIYSAGESEAWSPAEADPERVSQLRGELDLSPLLARFFIRRGEETAARVNSLCAADEQLLNSPVEITSLEPVLEALLEVIHSTGTVSLCCSPTLRNLPVLLILKNSLENFGAKVEVQPPGTTSEAELKLGLAGSPAEIADHTETTPPDFLLIGAPRSGDSADATQIVAPVERDYSAGYFAYKFCEALAREIYDARLPDFVALDLETTGYAPRTSEIIEIGAVRYEQGRTTESFQTFVDSTDTIPGKIQDLTGIEPADLEGAPAPGEALEQLAEFIGQSTLVAHNKGFDIPFLRYHFKKYLDRRLRNDSADSMRAAQSALPGLPGYDLGTVVDSMDIELTDHHRALDDARAAGEIFVRLKSETPRQVEALLEPLLVFGALAIAVDDEANSPEERELFRRGRANYRAGTGPTAEFLREISGPGPASYNGFSPSLFMRLGGAIDSFTELVDLFPSEPAGDKGQPKKIDNLIGKDDGELIEAYRKRRTDEFEKIRPGVDGRLDLANFDSDFLAKLDKLPPYNRNFPPPVVRLQSAEIINFRRRETIPDTLNRLTLSQDGEWVTAVFRGNKQPDLLEPGRSVELLAEPVVVPKPEGKQLILNCLSVKPQNVSKSDERRC